MQLLLGMVWCGIVCKCRYCTGVVCKCGMQMQLGAATRGGNMCCHCEWKHCLLYSLPHLPITHSASYFQSTVDQVLHLSLLIQLSTGLYGGEAKVGVEWSCSCANPVVPNYCTLRCHNTAVPYYGTDICTGSRKSGPSAKHKMAWPNVWIFFLFKLSKR